MSSIKIDRQLLKAFTGDAQKALTEIADKFGIKITYKSGSFARDGSNATIKFEMVAPDATTGGFVSREAQDFKVYATEYGFEPEDLGSEFTVNGTKYRITGLKTRRPKYPICAGRVSDGKGFKFPAETVKNAGQSGLVAQQIQQPRGLTPEIKRGFVRLVGELSPENLSCDGECSNAEVRKRRSNIMRQWGELERRAGRVVDETTAWSFSNV
jgi:hypothetical protein